MKKQKVIDVVSFGTCYVDINSPDYPFDENGIPTETELIGGTYETVAGGSSVNFCRLLQQRGLRTSFIGMSGTDMMGDVLERLLQSSGIQAEIVRQKELSTNVSFNMTNPQGKHIMLATGTANASLYPTVVLPRLEKLLPEVSFLYLGGSFKLTSFIDTYPQVITLAKRCGTKIVVDHGRIPKNTSAEMCSAIKELVMQADYYFPSRDEFFELWEVKTIESGLQFLAQQAPQITVIIKDGNKGAYYFLDGNVHHCPAVPVTEISDVTGAGDSFNAGVINAIVKNNSLQKAVQFGCEVAAEKISGKM